MSLRINLNMRTILFFFHFVLGVSIAISQDYNQIEIGTQIWTTENLNIERFRNGDKIPHVKSQADWEKANKKGNPAWCYYNFDSKNGEKYGKLYNWYAVNDPRGLAPEGWHVPTDSEWKKLSNHLGGDTISGLKLKSDIGWDENGNGTNEALFNGSPAGVIWTYGTFEGIGNYGVFWSSIESEDPMYVITYTLNIGNNFLNKSEDEKGMGFSVRCIRN
jgi:uncharacterized protein (TIGR02145 family)